MDFLLLMEGRFILLILSNEVSPSQYSQSHQLLRSIARAATTDKRRSFSAAADVPAVGRARALSAIFPPV